MKGSVFVTGVAGFLGRRVAQDLLEDGYRVMGCDDFSVSSPKNVPPEVLFREGKCEDLKFNDLLTADAVVHCAAIARSAWPRPQEIWTANVRGTQNVMHAARSAAIDNIVYASSSVVHHPDSSVYARTKSVAERLSLGAGATCLRFGNIYGPGQNELGYEPNVIASMRRSVRDNGVVRVDGTGEQTRDFVHVSDASNAVLSAIDEPLPAMWLDICTGVQTSIRTVAEAFNSPIVWGDSRNDPPAIIQDPKPAEILLHWTPSVSIEEGLKQVAFV